MQNLVVFAIVEEEEGEDTAKGETPGILRSLLLLKDLALRPSVLVLPSVSLLVFSRTNLCSVVDVYLTMDVSRNMDKTFSTNCLNQYPCHSVFLMLYSCYLAFYFLLFFFIEYLKVFPTLLVQLLMMVCYCESPCFLIICKQMRISPS